VREAPPLQTPPTPPEPAPSSAAAEFQLALQAEALLTGAGEAVLVTNGAGLIESVYGDVERLWGYPRQRLPGKKLSLLIANETRDRSAGPESGTAAGPVRRLRTEAYRQGGGTFPVEVRIARVETGGPPRFVMAVRDLTEQVRVEETLRSLQKALETMQVGVCVTDLDHRIVYANPAQAALHGYTVEELAGADARRLNPEAFSLSYEALTSARTFRREGLDVRKDGSRFPVELISDVVAGNNGAPLGMVTICQDIGERRRAEEALRESEERYALVVRGTNDGLWDWDLRTGKIYFSPRWKEMLGYAEEEVGDAPGDWTSLVHPQDAPSLERDLSAYLAGETARFENQHRMRHKDGVYRWMLARGTALRDRDGKAVRLAGSQTDITDRAVQDPLTELPTRRVFLERLGAALERTHLAAGRCAVLFIDLDGFKTVNDTLGHEAGDRLLVTVARRLESCLGPRDTVARLGGDEFAVLLDAGEASRAPELAAKITRELALPVPRQQTGIQASIGIGYGRPAHNRPEEVLREADLAMYEAKSRSRAQGGSGGNGAAPPRSRLLA
jgi:diguanylate cyclase (GGDEF)-like protein/PAS domain S-box-containing protein